MVRDTVRQLMNLGPLPAEAEDINDRLAAYRNAIQSITPPVNDEEACALVALFGPDECFGLAWSLVHLIETAPGWPIVECLKGGAEEWNSLLRDRAARGGRL